MDSCYDIFRGTLDEIDTWLEAVIGVNEAKMRMEQIAAEKPGKYFVFCIVDQSMIASVDTGTKSRWVNSDGTSS
jgi:hypothetical protein